MTPFIYSAPSYHLVIKSWQFKKLLPHYVFHLTQEISQTSCQLQNKVSFWFVIQAFHHHCSPAMKYFLPCNPFSLASDSLFLEYFNNTPVLCTCPVPVHLDSFQSCHVQYPTWLLIHSLCSMWASYLYLHLLRFNDLPRITKLG